jgi:hypothetical protein
MFRGTYIPTSKGETAEFRDVSGKAVNHGKTQHQTIFEFRSSVKSNLLLRVVDGGYGKNLPRYFTEMRRVVFQFLSRYHGLLVE